MVALMTEPKRTKKRLVVELLFQQHVELESVAADQETNITAIVKRLVDAFLGLDKEDRAAFLGQVSGKREIVIKLRGKRSSGGSSGTAPQI